MDLIQQKKILKDLREALLKHKHEPLPPELIRDVLAQLTIIVDSLVTLMKIYKATYKKQKKVLKQSFSTQDYDPEK